MQEKSFPGTLDSLSLVRAYVADAARAAGLNSGRTYSLCLAVDEIAMNIVLHGYEEAGIEGDIVIEARQEGDQLIISLSDHGQTYDPDQIPPPDVDNPLSQEDGGWGVFLARTGVDEFDYTSTDSGNVHRFMIRVPEIRADDHSQS